ncbi:MAG: thermonuclease family protein [Chloroflexota bacterium]|nr:thermonuclease family protein [Chloroflexota bacterium]MDE2884912.1 thermonuclease family protein [Chloroflexota bacterium]
MRTGIALTFLLALLATSCTPAPVPDGRIAELEATIETLRATPATPGLQRVRLVEAFDGDSGIAADTNGDFEFRLYGVDAPERDAVSRAALEQLIAAFGNNLYAEERDVDRYGRRVVVLRTGDGSYSVNVEMVRHGYAYAYLWFGELEGVVAAEAEARANRRGIWRMPR